jgi:glycosyltransferase involved in cell wall biosynthesis
MILTHWSFKDALVQTYTLPYVHMIREVLPPDEKIFIVTSEQERVALTAEEVERINQDWKEKNLTLVAQPYQAMGLKKMLISVRQLYRLYRLIKRNRISTIHCFCTPAGAIGFLLSKLSGARLIIDSYEPHAESMVENGTWKKKGFAFRLLFLLERLQSRRAAYFIGTSAGMKQYATEKYGIEPQPYFVKPACVDLDKFYPRRKDEELLEQLQLKQKIVCVYAGKLGGIYLKEEVFDFLAVCYDYWGERFRFLMLSNAPREEVMQELQRVGLPEHIVIQKFARHEDVPAYLSLGDFALNPVRPVPTKQYCTSIKDGEYWASGLPVVITRNISDDSGIITQNEIGYELKSLTDAEYRNAVRKIDTIIQEGNGVSLKIRGIAEQYRSFQIAEKIYKAIYA